jgi:pimeloyl-ACP methyl ester carboxylesterase
MELFYRKIGENKPALIILHGLYGASDNWMNLAKLWSEDYEVYLVDLRNHGQSPHSRIHTYQAMRDDVIELMDKQSIKKAVILGHSMGGKVAMRLAMDQPERLNALIVVDIAPKDYSINLDENVARHQKIIGGMLSLDLSLIKKRDDVNDLLSDAIPEQRTRQFIMKNLKRNKDQSFSWKLNLKVISDELLKITAGFADHNIYRDITGFPVLFIRGAKSKYIQNEDKSRIMEIFPMADIKTIEDAGHWIHAEQPEELSEIVLEFLE